MEQAPPAYSGTDIRRMQEKLAWLEDTLSDCCAELGTLSAHLQLLQQRLTIIEELLSGATDGPEAENETLPPHY